MKNTKQKRQFHSKSGNDGGITKSLLSAVIGAVAGYISFLLLLVLFSAVSAASATPLSLVFPASLASIYISAFVCGFSSAKKSGDLSPWLSALFGTLCFYVLMFLFSLPFNSEGSHEYSLLLRALVIPSSTLGAFCRLKASRKRRKKRF